MKTIRIFLASSDELQDDRNAFGNLVRRLDKIYEKRGMRIELFEWEDYDAAFNGVRKQDEYNDAIKASDMFLALFHTKAGKFTLEEFNVATEEFKQHSSPKVFTYCKDLQPGEVESPELAEFKKTLFEELGHYWCRYGNRDTMQLHFVMQLQLVEGNSDNKLKLEEGTVKLGGIAVANIDNIPFASENEQYCKMREELALLPEKIEKARQRLDKFPDDEDLKDDLQQKIDRYTGLKEEFTRLQKSLFETAKKISKIQMEQVSDRLRQAIEAFESGNLTLANTILEDMAREAECHMEQFEQNRALIHKDIEAFLLQADTLLADVSVPIEERIERVKAIYEKADVWAGKTDYERIDYLDLLLDYSRFLYNYSFHNEAIIIAKRLVEMSEEEYGEEYPINAFAYQELGRVYASIGLFSEAEKFLLKAFDDWTLWDEEDKDKDMQEYTNSLLQDITSLYARSGALDRALEFAEMTLQHIDAIEGRDEDRYHCYLTIARIYRGKGDFVTEKEYLDKAETIAAQSLKDEPQSYSFSLVYSELAQHYYMIGDYLKALEYSNLCLNITERELGPSCDTAADMKEFIGLTYHVLGDYDKAESVLLSALSIYNKGNNQKTAKEGGCRIYLSMVYLATWRLDLALKYNTEGIAIYEQTTGLEHPDLVDADNTRGMIMRSQGNMEDAETCFKKALEIQQKVSGEMHPGVANAYMCLGQIYNEKGNNEAALECFNKSFDIQKSLVGPDHLNTLMAEYCMAQSYLNLGDCDKAFELTEDARQKCEDIISGPYMLKANCYALLGFIYRLKGEYAQAESFLLKSIEMFSQLGLESSDSYGFAILTMGMLYEGRQEYGKALGFYDEAESIFLLCLGENNIRTANAKEGAGKSLIYLKRYDEGITRLQEALAAFEAVCGEDSLPAGACRGTLGWGYMQQGDYETALSYLCDAEAIMRRKLPEDNEAWNEAWNIVAGQIDFCKEHLKRPLLKRLFRR